MKARGLKLMALGLLSGLVFSCGTDKENQSRPGYSLYFHETAEEGTPLPEPSLIIKSFRYQDGTGSNAFNKHAPSLVIRFNEADSEAFFRFTEKNLGKKAAIYYRGEELLSAMIMEPIPGGEVRINCTDRGELDQLLELLGRE
jgi:preprotein translocase subunit SecD